MMGIRIIVLVSITPTAYYGLMFIDPTAGLSGRRGGVHLPRERFCA